MIFTRNQEILEKYKHSNINSTLKLQIAFEFAWTIYEDIDMYDIKYREGLSLILSSC